MLTKLIRWLAPWTQNPNSTIQEWKRGQMINDDTAKMMSRIMLMANRQVEDVMVTKGMMCTIDVHTPLEQVIAMIVETGHSRFPLIDPSQDKVLGVIMAKDLLRASLKNEPIDLKALSRPIKVIPETRSLSLLLREFRLSHKHMAVVVNEYGSISGLITIEDVLEQIVGEIEDEFDTQQDHMIDKISHNCYEMPALTPIEHCNQVLGTAFTTDQYDTMAGLIMHALGRLPKRNETLQLHNTSITVTNVDARRIKHIEITLPEQDKSH